ncbi:hypothetical protein PGB90_007312 [Kerria lacca]
MFFGKKKSVNLEESRIYIPQRYIFGLLGFLALANAYIQRFNLSLTITEMTHPIYHHSGNKDNVDCPGSFHETNKTKESYEFSWDETIQGVILSAVFWGYVVTMIPGGMIAERYGGKHTLGFGMLCSTISTLITPFIVRKTNFIGLICMRVFIGLGQGPLYPSLNVLLSQWAPMHERCRLGALVFAGAQVGNVISMALTGIVLQTFEWTSVFYLYGVFGLIWYVLWLVFISDVPASHPFITDKEKKYLADTVTDVTDERRNLPLTPWKRILTSPAVWGVILAQIGHDWGLFTIITDLPKYMKQVLHFSVAENGVLSALPYLSMWISALITGVLCDWLIKTKGCNVTFVRKVFVTIAATGPAIGTIAASYAGCSKVAVTICFTAGMALMGAFVPSLKVNPLDLSPNFAGSLMAVVGCIGAISGIFAPQVVGLLTTHGTLLEWRNVFWISFYMLIVTNVIFLIFGSGEVQPWNEIAMPTEYQEKSEKSQTNEEFPSEIEKNVETRRSSVFISGIPIDITRRQSVFVSRPLIQ